MNNEEQPSGSPWMKNLLIWGGIFAALMLAVSMFGNKGEAPGAPISYSDFRGQVAGGKVEAVQVAEKKITGKFKDGKTFTTVPIPGDDSLAKLLQDNGVQYDGKPSDEPGMLAYILIQILPFALLIGLAIFVMRQVQKGGGAGGAMGFGKSKAKMLTEKQGR
ncbi:MAG: ATP-dependent metallopeptidase FtsH/Yme1/Tma family protein, partial [Novosphingobium sp.]